MIYLRWQVECIKHVLVAGCGANQGREINGGDRGRKSAGMEADKEINLWSINAL
jgi:hypothetical protein